MMFWYGNGMAGWGYALMTVSMVLFWALVIAAVVVLVRYLRRDTQPTLTSPPQRHTPEHVLAERFARGDIDDEEYRRRLDTLRAHPRPDVKS
jgi:putative membrane protein